MKKLLLLLLLISQLIEAKDFTIVYSGFSRTNPFWVILSKGVAEESNKLGIKLIDITTEIESADKQKNGLTNVLSQNIDGIIIGPYKPESLVSVLD